MLEKALLRRLFYEIVFALLPLDFESLRPSKPRRNPQVCRLHWDPEAQSMLKAPFPQMAYVTRGPKALYFYGLSKPKYWP